MPKIPTYDASVSPEGALPSPRARATGNDGLAYLGQGLMDVADRMYDHEQREEVGNLNAQMATLRGELTSEFIKGSAENAGNPDYTDKFMENVTNKLQTIGGNIKTRAGQSAWQRESAELTSSFLAKTTEYNVAVAGAKAMANYGAMVNESAGTLFNDPSQFNSVEKGIRNAFTDPSGPYAGVPAEKRAALENHALEQLSIAAGRGWAMQNPDFAEKMYKAGTMPGQKYLTEAGNAQIVGYISTMQNAERTKRSLALAEAERAKRQADENATRNIVAYLVQNPNSPEAVDKIMKSAASPEHQVMLLALAGRSIADKAHDQNTYGSGFYQTYQDIQSGKIRSMDDLTKQVGPNGTLTLAGVNQLAAELQGRRSPEGKVEAELKNGFIAAMGKQISGSNEMLGIKDPKGEALKQQALAWFLPAYERAKQEGKYPDSVLLDPGNPHSLWAGVMRFKRTPNEYMADLMSGVGAGPVQIKDDAEYAKLPKGAQYIGPDGKPRTKK